MNGKVFRPGNGSKGDGKDPIILQERLNHTIFFNFKARAKAFIGGPHVTLTTIADTNFLHHIVPMVQRWNGPISLCVFAPGDHFDLAVRQIQWLVSCSNTSLVHDWVSFHFVFPKALGPNKIFKWNNIPEKGEDPCFAYDVRKGETTNIVTYKQRSALVFPINLLRNIAMEGVALELFGSNQFVFPCDIEMIPSPNLATKFEALIERMDLSDREQRVAFLLPEFEIKAGEALPANKTTLLHEMRRTKNVVMFHQKTTGMLHVIPSMMDWIGTPERDDSNLELLPKLEGPIPGRWEPLFIIRQDIMPHFDERLTWETKSDKVLLANDKDVLLGNSISNIEQRILNS
ncbi:beta-1,4-glucuronyltransferase 1-like [Tigriopus californicus]|uniref:beta-1,4-glucuronyltransferase 1-like n=1 Tax=Tigriopus californicus TaxID=6832 RepID=UPI0027DA5303|nr:beta-1,4-glucuronyltransferase 1-like [Tigriopus californicus]